MHNQEPLIDEVALARVGDTAAWEGLLQRYGSAIAVYIHKLVPDRDIAFDLIQETFLHAMKSITQLKDNSSFAPWLFRIAYRRCLHYWEERKKTPASLDHLDVELAGEAAVQPLSPPSHYQVALEDREEMEKILGNMPRNPSVPTRNYQP
ncbi:RNA polymerase sigma factor [Planctomycetota bacterium]